MSDTTEDSETASQDEDTSRIFDNPFAYYGLILLTGIVAVLSINVILLLNNNMLDSASVYSNIVSGLATVILVAVTYKYTQHTREIVEENQRSRNEQRRREREQRERKREGLRRALISEIRSVENLEKISGLSDESLQTNRYWGRDEIYRSSTDQLHLLTSEEIKRVTDYYGMLEQLRQFAEAHRQEKGIPQTDSGEGELSRQTSRLRENQAKAVKALESELRE